MDSTEAGSCPTPFLQESLFPKEGGFVDGRFCFVTPTTGTACCLPCPQTDWLYADNFGPITMAANWVNVGSMICSVFLLLSFAFLPIEKTHRHYLSICLCIATVLMELGFIVPLAAQPDQCYNDITPNDMGSSATCAISGAFLLVGAWCAVMWTHLRVVSLHLQIVWKVNVGKTFKLVAMTVGWGIPAIGLALLMTFSGVSFRFGDTCHINHTGSLADFWIPLLVFSGATVLIQFFTFGYVIKVYLSAMGDKGSTTNSSGLPTYTGSIATVSPRQAYRRVKRVLQLQWRGIALVLLIVGDVIFFTIVFVFLDDAQQSVTSSNTKAEPWLLCLAKATGDDNARKNACLDLAGELMVNEATVMAVLMLLSLNGVWLLVFLGRSSMFTGWYDLFLNHFRPSHARDFVSVDAVRSPSKGLAFYDHKGGRWTPNAKSYEMLNVGKNDEVGATDLKVPEPVVSPISPFGDLENPNNNRCTTFEIPKKGNAGDGRQTPDYFPIEARYTSPNQNFSAPRPKRTEGGSGQGTGNSTPTMGWDHHKSFAAPSVGPNVARPKYPMAIDPLAMNKI